MLTNQTNNTLTVDDYLADADVHEVHYQPITGVPLVAIFTILLSIGHIINAYMLFWVETPVLLNLVIHLILVGIAGFLVFLMKKSSFDTRFAMLVFITSAVMGVVGTIGSLVALLQSLFYLQYRTSFEEWYQSIFPQGRNSLPEDIAENIELGYDENPENYSVIPFMDVMEVGSERQKREALSKMTAGFDPRFATAFRRALVDESSAIRVQAATAITRIENNFHDRLLKIEGLYREHPRNIIILKALADHYDSYAFTGILDHERETINREKALNHYLEYLNLRPDDVQVRSKVGRLLIRMNRDQEAVEWLKRCLDEGYNSDVIKVWYIESLYRIEDYDSLRLAASSYQVDLSGHAASESEIADSIYLWAQASLSDKQTKMSGA